MCACKTAYKLAYQMSRFLYTSIRCQTKNCFDFGHLVVASDTSGLPDNWICLAAQYGTENVQSRLTIWKIMPKNRRFNGLFLAKLLKIWPYGGLGAHRKFGTTSPSSARLHHLLIGLQSTQWKSRLPSL